MNGPEAVFADGTTVIAGGGRRVVVAALLLRAGLAERVRSAALRYIGEKETLVNQLRVAGSTQVNLRVRVAEVARTVTKQLGFNWEAIVSPGAFSFGLATGRAAFNGSGVNLSNPGNL